MALRDPTAAKGVQVVAHFPRQRMDAVVERIDWHKVDARATSEEALEDVLISFDWKGKRWTGPIAEESLTLRDHLHALCCRGVSQGHVAGVASRARM